VDRNHSGPQYQRKGLRYASGVAQAEWAIIEPHLPAAKPLEQARKHRVDGDRQCVTLYRQDGLSMADVAARFSALLDGASLTSMLGVMTGRWSGSISSKLVAGARGGRC